MGAMIPLLTLGIPFAAPSAVMLAGLRMHNIELGPMLLTNRPDLFWTFIAAMYIGNVMLLVLNLPLVGFFGRIAAIRPQIIIPVISIFCLFGTYSVRNSIFDVWVMIFSGIAGFFLRRRKFPLAPFIIGIVLGPTTENSVRQTLMLLKGDLTLIAYRPIAAALLTTALLFILFKLFSFLRGRKIDLKIKEQV
jgi:putative tricarboxylic transport membrane protein